VVLLVHLEELLVLQVQLAQLVQPAALNVPQQSTLSVAR
jgi:hypothetical protein